MQTHNTNSGSFLGESLPLSQSVPVQGRLAAKAPRCNVPVHGHEINGLNDQIEIFKEAGEPGRVSNSYIVQWFTGRYTGTRYQRSECSSYFSIQFQEGPVSRNGVNGISNEVLLAIVVDRLSSYQAGPKATRENGLALEKVESALHWLRHRAQNRTVVSATAPVIQGCTNCPNCTCNRSTDPAQGGA